MPISRVRSSHRHPQDVHEPTPAHDERDRREIASSSAMSRGGAFRGGPAISLRFRTLENLRSPARMRWAAPQHCLWLTSRMRVSRPVGRARLDEDQVDHAGSLGAGRTGSRRAGSAWWTGSGRRRGTAARSPGGGGSNGDSTTFVWSVPKLDCPARSEQPTTRRAGPCAGGGAAGSSRARPLGRRSGRSRTAWRRFAVRLGQAAAVPIGQFRCAGRRG